MPTTAFQWPGHGRILAALALAGILATGAVLATHADGENGSVADSDAQIAAALARRDATIRVAPGRYGDLAIARRREPVTIESAEPARPATFAGVTIGSAGGVTLRNLAVERRVGEPLRQQLVSIRKATGVVLDGLRITAPGGTERGREYAVMIRSSDGVRVVGSRIGGMRYGIGMLDSRNVAIERNELRDLQTDGIRGGGVDDLVIAGNVLGRFRPKPGEHPDGIQLWTANQKTPARRIAIRDNLIARDGGGITQGIFVRDNRLQLPFEGLEIRGNLVIGTMYNGIAVQGAVAPVVVDNEVIAFPDQKSWIRLQAVRGGTLTDNRAQQFLQIATADLRTARNRVTKPARSVPTAAVRAWVDAAPGRGVDAGPYLRALASGSPAQ